MSSEPIERARRALDSAKISRAMRDVSADVAAVRSALGEAKASPESIGTKDHELDGFIRDGLISEAKNIFALVADGCGWEEREFFFSQIVELVTKAAGVGRATDDEVVRRLRENDPCAGLPIATPEQVGAIYASLDVDALDFSSFDRETEAGNGLPLAEDDEYPEITVVLLDGNALDDQEGPAENVEDDDVIDVQDAWLEDGMLSVRRGPPPLPKQDAATDDIAGPALPFTTDDVDRALAAAGPGDDGFDAAEERWFSRVR